ncbi:glycosyltransferase [Pseudomonas sp. PD9R]|nr:glycosyltransferase [Pseudomonas sp. PD9R]
MAYTLKSILSQAVDDVEIIVSDNVSEDGTKELVESLGGGRIRYINPGVRLAMTEHWEFAVGHALGEYVCIIGDDDAVSKGGVRCLLDEISKSAAPVYSWPTHVYIWPIGDQPPRIELSPLGAVKELDLHRLVKFALKWGLCNYLPLPHLYHSAVRRDVLEAIKSATGSYFKTTAPDVYMSYAIPVFSPVSIDLGVPVTISGHSSKSNAGSVLLKGVGSGPLNAFMKECDGYQVHEGLPKDISQKITLLLDVVFVAKDSFPDFYRDIKLNHNGMWAFIESVMYGKYGFRVLANWKSIRRVCDVSLFGYFYYASAFAFNKFRSKWRSKSQPQIQNSTVVPNDIFAFSQQCEELH